MVSQRKVIARTGVEGRRLYIPNLKLHTRGEFNTLLDKTVTCFSRADKISELVREEETEERIFLLKVRKRQPCLVI